MKLDTSSLAQIYQLLIIVETMLAFLSIAALLTKILNHVISIGFDAGFLITALENVVSKIKTVHIINLEWAPWGDSAQAQRRYRGPAAYIPLR